MKKKRKIIFHILFTHIIYYSVIGKKRFLQCWRVKPLRKEEEANRHYYSVLRSTCAEHEWRCVVRVHLCVLYVRLCCGRGLLTIVIEHVLLGHPVYPLLMSTLCQCTGSRRSMVQNCAHVTFVSTCGMNSNISASTTPLMHMPEATMMMARNMAT